MKKPIENLSKAEKILLFLYDVGRGSSSKVRYEDIVAGLFKKYPQEFQLKGYPEYPDSGDLIHKPLYDFKKKGYVNAANKVFSLTDRGVEFAAQLSGKGSAPVSDGRFSRSAETEVSRIKGLEGFALFVEGKTDDLSDNDLYNYLGVTVRTRGNAFIGRLKTMAAIVKELKERHDPLCAKIADYHEHLMSKHKDTIAYLSEN